MKPFQHTIDLTDPETYNPNAEDFDVLNDHIAVIISELADRYGHIVTVTIRCKRRPRTK